MLRTTLFSLALICAPYVAMSTDLPNFTLNTSFSKIAQPQPPITVNTARHTGNYFFSGIGGRNHAAIDINKDGLNDIIVAPSYFDNLPELPIQIWINKGNGVFEDQTAAYIDGPVPTTGSPNNIFVGDFNEDDRPDIFIVDQGQELVPCGVAPGCAGGKNKLLLSQPNGKLKDLSASLPLNELAFNHVSAMGDLNGDGHLDIVLTDLGGRQLRGGIRMLLGDGTGNFLGTTAGLPIGIAKPIPWNTSPEYSSPPGAVAIADLDGDGQAELLTGTYAGGDPSGAKPNIRIHKKQANGNFVEVSRIPYPAALDSITYCQSAACVGSQGGAGIAGIYAGNLHGNGRNDLVIYWESYGSSYIQILRNDGNFQFTDVTIQAVGSFDATNYLDNNFAMASARFELLDFNGDGYLDIVTHTYGVTAGHLTDGTAKLIWLNDGTGRFSRWQLKSSGRVISESELRSATPNIYSFTPSVMDVNGDGLYDVVFMDASKDATWNQSLIQTKNVLMYSMIQQDLVGSDVLFNLAERVFADLFPSHGISTWISDFYARCYGTGKCIGMKDGATYYYDGQQINNLGSMYQYVSKPLIPRAH